MGRVTITTLFWVMNLCCPSLTLPCTRGQWTLQIVSTRESTKWQTAWHLKEELRAVTGLQAKWGGGGWGGRKGKKGCSVSSKLICIYCWCWVFLQVWTLSPDLSYFYFKLNFGTSKNYFSYGCITGPNQDEDCSKQGAAHNNWWSLPIEILHTS